MKITRRSNRRLPSLLELSIYLFAVIVFCVINWTILKAVNPEQRAPKSFESMVLEQMLEDMPPMTLPEDRMMLDGFGRSGSYALGLDPWMLSSEAFSRYGIERDIMLEEWMIDTAAW